MDPNIFFGIIIGVIVFSLLVWALIVFFRKPSQIVQLAMLYIDDEPMEWEFLLANSKEYEAIHQPSKLKVRTTRFQDGTHYGNIDEHSLENFELKLLHKRLVKLTRRQTILKAKDQYNESVLKDL